MNIKIQDLLARLGSLERDTSYLVQNKQAEYKLELAADGPPQTGQVVLEDEVKLGWQKALATKIKINYLKVKS